jgi:hypothetical protein
VNKDERAKWNARPMVVTTSTHCPECKTLRPDPDVQERRNYWPNITAMCCADCFSRLIGEYQSAVAC